jgi:hypothetical protein
MSDLLALAERVEKATGPDWTLNAEIEIAVLGFPHRAYDQQNGMRPRGTPAIDRLEFVRKGWASDYTGSIDAATSLFPGETMYRSGHSATGPDPSMFFCDAVTDAPLCADVHALAMTEPLARSAAALRARAASTPSLNAEIAEMGEG